MTVGFEWAPISAKEILLCWRLGEDKIKYWHEADSGYDERKPIDLLKNA